MSVLEIRDIALAYSGTPAVDGVDLAVDSGEILCLVGPSGCGKTTLLRLIAGLERPDRGTIELGGEVVADAHASRPPEVREVGLVFQQYALFPHLTVEQNVRFGLSSSSPADRRARASESLEAVGMASMGARFPEGLSGGEQQRVALARALAPRPQVLLLDEPFSGLDASTRLRVREETRVILRDSRAAALLVTHDGEEAMQLGDRIAVMRGGRIVQIGSADDLYHRPVDAFVASFFGEVNELFAVVHDGHAKTPIGDVPAPAFAGGDRVRVIVRHEALDVLSGADASSSSGRVSRVEETCIVGGQRMTTVRVEGVGDGPALVRLRHRVDDRFARGDTVVVNLRPGLAHVFPA
ncbi:MAG: ABC transporter ATP-binding protein [Planctomycetota bacterium]